MLTCSTRLIWPSISCLGRDRGLAINLTLLTSVLMPHVQKREWDNPPVVLGQPNSHQRLFPGSPELPSLREATTWLLLCDWW